MPSRTCSQPLETEKVHYVVFGAVAINLLGLLGVTRTWISLSHRSLTTSSVSKTHSSRSIPMTRASRKSPLKIFSVTRPLRN